jgi:uncharacterized membrane protein
MVYLLETKNELIMSERNSTREWLFFICIKKHTYIRTINVIYKQEHKRTLFCVMRFVLLLIIVELFLYLYHINDIHKYKFEDFLILKRKEKKERNSEFLEIDYVYIRHSRPHFDE